MDTSLSLRERVGVREAFGLCFHLSNYTYPPSNQ